MQNDIHELFQELKTISKFNTIPTKIDENLPLIMSYISICDAFYLQKFYSIKIIS